MENYFITDVFSLANRPLVQDHRKWLRSFLESFPQWVEGDTLASTYASMGAVILAAVATDCRESEFLDGLLRLPNSFVAFVVNVMDATCFWASKQILDLECALRDHSYDFAAIEDSLHAVKEELWNTYWSRELGMLLDLYRARYLVGGTLENWIDDESVNDYQTVM